MQFRSALAVGVCLILLASTVCGEETRKLDDLLSLAARGLNAPAERENPDGIYRALQDLCDWPQGSVEDESRITSTLEGCLYAKNKNISAAAAGALGHRGHGEIMPLILKLGEDDPGVIYAYFGSYAPGRQIESPTELFRRGLQSKNPYTRSSVVMSIAFCKDHSLVDILQKMLEADPAENVRESVAHALQGLQGAAALPALRHAFDAGFRSKPIVYGLANYGSDDDIATILSLLQSGKIDVQRAVVQGLSPANLHNPLPVCDALLAALHTDSMDLRFDLLKALSRFHEVRAIPFIRAIVLPTFKPWTSDDLRYYAEDIGDIGGSDAIALLNDLAEAGYITNSGVADSMARLASPSSGQIAWKIYCIDPVRRGNETRPGAIDNPDLGNHQALEVLNACADVETLEAIRVKARTSTYSHEKQTLQYLAERIQKRLAK